MLSFARVDLGLTEAEFWALTPAKFFSLAERVSARETMQDFRAGALVWVVRKIAGDKQARIEDFFPSLKAIKKNRAQSVQELKSQLNSLIASQQERKRKNG